ncbi:hypothetical protein Celaphus_00000559 [Cervus elaphus hippelaphus]|uniref:Uncharacterized protein n=1 Tax=Cervus elaphus hippelaphus TaxID=46360 RepID=A0A212D930_CEREH|nr:hypothetical protein Celaphus_00000559 [Cervus elaphus hippelaphus]
MGSILRRLGLVSSQEKVSSFQGLHLMRFSSTSWLRWCETLGHASRHHKPELEKVPELRVSTFPSILRRRKDRRGSRS